MATEDKPPPIGAEYDSGSSVAIQSDGKIVVAGSSSNGPYLDFALLRYNSDGTLDNTFSGDGKLTTAIGASDDGGHSVAIQPDGKIVVAGFSYNGTNNDFVLVRYNSDGTLDNTFSGDGKQTTAVVAGNDGGHSVAIQPDGKIVVAGSSSNGTNADFALLRYNSDGTIDNAFSGDGKLTTAIGTGDDYGKSIAIQSDGKIVVAGSYFGFPNNFFALARYNSDGLLDNDFNGGGK